MSDVVVETHDLTVRLGSQLVLRDVSLAITRGSVLVVLGPNGSGKSTFVRALLGLVRLERGDVRVFGLPPREVSPERIGYVPQIKTLDRSFPGTGIELVVSGMKRRWPWYVSRAERNRAMSALSLLGSEHLANRPIGETSGGELQKLYLVRALAREARLILLDEPAAGVDVVGEETLHDFVDAHRRASDVTFVIVTHDLSVATDHATHVLLLNRRQIGFGAAADVLTNDALTRTFGHAGHPYAEQVRGRDHV